MTQTEAIRQAVHNCGFDACSREIWQHAKQTLRHKAELSWESCVKYRLANFPNEQETQTQHEFFLWWKGLLSKEQQEREDEIVDVGTDWMLKWYPRRYAAIFYDCIEDNKLKNELQFVNRVRKEEQKKHNKVADMRRHKYSRNLGWQREFNYA